MPAASQSRRRYIDAARGLAVLLMIEAHTFDAWTRAADRTTTAYGRFMILGGFAAPLFLFLAGLAVPLAGYSALRKTGSRRSAASAAVSRGLLVFILAFAFRLQTFIVTPGNSLLSIFRVDILNVMGPSLAVCAVVWALCVAPAAFGVTMAVAAAGVAMLTPIVRAAPWVDALPVWFQWYLRPAAEFTTFTLLPWSGFVFGGAVIGSALAGATEAQERRRMTTCGVAGLVLVAFGFYTATLPSLYASSSFWTSSPTYFAIRIGVMMVALSLGYVGDLVWKPTGKVGLLQRLGQNSLFLYWIHVELVYGYASTLWKRRLPLPVTCLAFVAFVALMFGAVLLRDRMRHLKPWTRFRPAPAPAVTVS